MPTIQDVTEQLKEIQDEIVSLVKDKEPAPAPAPTPVAKPEAGNVPPANAPIVEPTPSPTINTPAPTTDQYFDTLNK